MKSFTFASATALLASIAVAAPLDVEKRQTLTDADILQFALTLEHLENDFYTYALGILSEQDFLDAGFSSAYYENLQYVAADEFDHVNLLYTSLQAAGATPVEACTYSFPYTDAASFVTLASVLEGVGVSAYLGAAPAIMSPEYLTVAGSILVTEAIHTSLQRFNLGEIAPANPYGTPLGANEVYTLAAAFITSCPSTNAPLPFTAFPTLTATPGVAYQDTTWSFTTTASLPSTFYATFVSGLTTMSMTASFDGAMVYTYIPATVSGQTYVILTNTNTTMLTDSQVIAGPAILEVTPAPAVYGYGD